MIADDPEHGVAIAGKAREGGVPRSLQPRSRNAERAGSVSDRRVLRRRPPTDTISNMDDMGDMARDPKHRRSFENLLYLAARRGDADLVAERLSWGIDPNCTSRRRRTPVIVNVRGFCPSVATVRALLAHGADPKLMDDVGLTALDYARRKLAKIQSRPARGRSVRRDRVSLPRMRAPRLRLGRRAYQTPGPAPVARRPA